MLNARSTRIDTKPVHGGSAVNEVGPREGLDVFGENFVSAGIWTPDHRAGSLVWPGCVMDYEGQETEVVLPQPTQHAMLHWKGIHLSNVKIGPSFASQVN